MTGRTAPEKSPLSDSVVEALRMIVGASYVVVDPEVTATYRADWTGRFHSGAVPVVRPASVAEVQAVVALANLEHFHVVPQGGNTGLVGGSVPTSTNSVIVSTERLRATGPIDTLGAHIIVEAGVKLSELQEALQSSGWTFGVDLGARESCTIGGMVATNAGGINVVRYGTMRRQVLGIEAVLGDGTIVSHMAALEKDNTGYDLEGLLTGSEGTLGIITKVALRLRSTPKRMSTALLAVSDVSAAVRVAAHLRRVLPSLDALEFMLGTGVRLVRSVFGGEMPWPVDDLTALLLVEVAGDGDVDMELAAACAFVASDLTAEPAVATGPSSRAALWRWREEHTAAIGTIGVPLKLDISLPQRAISAFIAELDTLPLSAPAIVFGHLGDGNLHVNVPGAFGSKHVSGSNGGPNTFDSHGGDDAALVTEALILELVMSHGGSISAEHGIGVAKVPYLSLGRTPAELRTFARLKAALDPNGVLNPGVLLPR